MIILIAASLSSNTYNKASWRADLTFEGIASMSFVTSILLWDLWYLWSSLSSFTDRSETREPFPRTETIRSQSSSAGKPSNLNPASKERDDFRFCWTVRNGSLFLTHPTYFLQYYPHENIVCIHMYDENMKSIESDHCHRPWSIFWLIVQIYLLTIEYQVVQFVSSFSISQKFESIHVTILQQISCLLL